MPYEQNRLTAATIPCVITSPNRKPVLAAYNDPGKHADQLLWESFKQGDESAFVNIYQSYRHVLYHYGCQIACDKEMVKDCLQDFFIYLRKNKSGFGTTNSIKLYLLKAFKRRVVDYLRKHSSRFETNRRFASSILPEELSTESVYVNQQVKAEQLEKLNRAMKRLGRKEREAIYYFYFEGLSYEQIAEILKFTHISSARRIMYRGIKHLRTMF